MAGITIFEIESTIEDYLNAIKKNCNQLNYAQLTDRKRTIKGLKLRIENLFNEIEKELDSRIEKLQ